MGYCYEAFGIITNKALLEEAGYSVDDITNFETLKAVAEDIHARSAELGFDAFTSSGMDGSSSWRFSGHLANMPLYYKYVVSWAFNYTPTVDTWRAAVVAAMTQYSAGGSWDDVVTAFVQGWATQYANQ